jgi:DNA repair protein RadA/Sms
MQLSDHDVFVNVVGGVRIDEPGADLAVALAVASAAKNVALMSAAADGDGRVPLVCFGEIGLTGELRPVTQPDKRVAEALKFGLNEVIFPTPRGEQGGVSSVREALARALH